MAQGQCSKLCQLVWLLMSLSIAMIQRNWRGKSRKIWPTILWNISSKDQIKWNLVKTLILIQNGRFAVLRSFWKDSDFKRHFFQTVLLHRPSSLFVDNMMKNQKKSPTCSVPVCQRVLDDRTKWHNKNPDVVDGKVVWKKLIGNKKSHSKTLLVHTGILLSQITVKQELLLMRGETNIQLRTTITQVHLATQLIM